jgi:hypothetical protein
MAGEPFYWPEDDPREHPAGLYRRDGSGKARDYLRCGPFVIVRRHVADIGAGTVSGHHYLLAAPDPASPEAPSDDWPPAWRADGLELTTPEAWQGCPEAVPDDPAVLRALSQWVRSTAPNPPEARSPRWDGGRLTLPPVGLGPAGYGETLGTEADALITWRKVAQLAASLGNERVALTMGAAFGGCYVAPLGRMAFTVHLVGDSTQGKTTALRVCAAMLGNPGEDQDGAGTLRTWNMTSIGLGRIQGDIGCLPVVVDELGASGRTVAQHTTDAFRFSEGAARTTARRGGGTVTGATWRSVTISSGNESFGERDNLGLAVRVLEIASPITASAEAAEALSALVLSAHGWPLAWLLDAPELPAMFEALARYRSILERDYGGPVRRMAGHVALAVAGAERFGAILDAPELGDAALSVGRVILAEAATVAYERGEGSGNRLLDALAEDVATAPALWYGASDDPAPEWRSLHGRAWPPGTHDLVSALVIAPVTATLDDLCKARSIDKMTAIGDLGKRGLLLPGDRPGKGRQRLFKLGKGSACRVCRGYHFLISDNDDGPGGYGGYGGYGPAQRPDFAVTTKAPGGYRENGAATCPVTTVTTVTTGREMVTRLRENALSTDSGARALQLSPAYETGPQDDYLAWIGGLIDAAEAEGEPVDWLALTADETAAVADSVTRNLAELVSAKRALEDPDAPRAPAPPVVIEDPESAAAFEALTAADTRTRAELITEAEAREDRSAFDWMVADGLLERDPWPVSALAQARRRLPVEAPGSAPLVTARRREAPAAPSRPRKAPAGRGAKAGAVPVKPRPKPSNVARGYVPLATDGRVIVAPDGSRCELPEPVEALDAGHVAEAARELSAGRTAVVQVLPAAHDALGLPGLWAVGPEVSGAELLDAHPLAARARARGVPVRLASNASGALAVGETHADTVEIDFPAWSGSGDFRNTADLDGLERATVKFAEALGFTYATSGAATVTHLIRVLNPKLGPAWSEPEAVDPKAGGSWKRARHAVPGNGWHRELSTAEKARPYVAVYDRSGSYASTWGGLVIGTGRFEHQAGPVELPSRDTPAGYWLLDVDPLREALGLGTTRGDPFAKHGAPSGPQWLTTPLAQLARGLAGTAGLDLRALDAYVQATSGRFLTKPGERVRAARETLAADPSPEAKAALAVVKTGYSAALGWTEYSNTARNDPLNRPYMNRANIDRFGANLWRSLEHADPAPFGWVDIDACLFAVEAPEAAPWPAAKIGPAYGQWKRKGRAVPMAEAVELLDAGNVRGLVALAENEGSPEQ